MASGTAEGRAHSPGEGCEKLPQACWSDWLLGEWTEDIHPHRTPSPTPTLGAAAESRQTPGLRRRGRAGGPFFSGGGRAPHGRDTGRDVARQQPRLVPAPAAGQGLLAAAAVRTCAARLAPQPLLSSAAQGHVPRPQLRHPLARPTLVLGDQRASRSPSLQAALQAGGLLSLPCQQASCCRPFGRHGRHTAGVCRREADSGSYHASTASTPVISSGLRRLRHPCQEFSHSREPEARPNVNTGLLGQAPQEWDWELPEAAGARLQWPEWS